jgi:predicted NBD/HSP70 family sugar kinase/biotin operon repressor
MLMVSQQTLVGSNSSTVKSHNLRAILLALLRQEHVSRVQLAELTGLSTTTITNLVTELLEQGIVVEEGTETLERRPGAGRPRMALRLVPEARYAIGVHIGVGSVRVAITDLRATILHSRFLDHPLDRSAETVLAETAQLIRCVAGESKISLQDVIGIGIGASGLVNPAIGVNLIAPNLGWRDVMIGDRLSEDLGLPVRVDNNVRAMALGEALFGPAQNVRVLAFVYARIGVGAGLVVDGQLQWGSGAGAGEIGHTTIVPDGGALCRCGNTGCLETLVSEPAIMALARAMIERDGQSRLAACVREANEVTIEQVFAAGRAGDVATQTMLAERARYMGIALANLVNILNPDLILLGGIFAQGQDLLLPTVEATVRQRAFANLGERVKLQPTTFGHNAGMTGAAALALAAFFYQHHI